MAHRLAGLSHNTPTKFKISTDLFIVKLNNKYGVTHIVIVV